MAFVASGAAAVPRGAEGGGRVGGGGREGGVSAHLEGVGLDREGGRKETGRRRGGGWGHPGRWFKGAQLILEQIFEEVYGSWLRTEAEREEG